MASADPGASFMDSLPDPMKLQLPVVAFVVVLLVLLFTFLKFVLFKPLTQVMDDREQAILSGSATKAEAAAQIEARQADYAARLKELRGKASDYRKTLAQAVAAERQGILDEARQQAFAQRDCGPRGTPSRAEGGRGGAAGPGGSPLRIHGPAPPEAGLIR